MPYWERGVDEWVPQDVPGGDAQDLPPPAAMAQLPAKEDRVLTMLLEKKVGVQTREKAHCVRDWARGPDLMLQ